MSNKTTLTSPLLSTLENASRDRCVNLDYLSHHCGLSLKDFENRTKLSKYAQWCESALEKDFRINEKEKSSYRLYELAKQETIHPNFTKNWGYLNPYSASSLTGQDIYQIYLTRPSLTQFDEILNIARSLRDIVVKYARLKPLETRHDTVIVYVTGAKSAKEVWRAAAACAEPCGQGSVPGFATVSWRNLSMARLKELPETESNGQKWQKIVEKTLTDTQYMNQIMSEVMSEFDHLLRILRGEKG